MALSRSSFFLRFVILSAIGHAYVGLRLIADAPVGAAVAAGGWLWLALSCVLIPMGMLSRRASHPRP